MFHVIKAGGRGIAFEQFYTGNYVAIFFDGVDYRDQSLEQIKNNISSHNSELTPGQVGMMAGQIIRFLSIKKDQFCITYDPSKRMYHLGRATGIVWYHIDEGGSLRQGVNREYEVSRDVLPLAIKNSLGAISTVFSLPDESGKQMINLAKNPSQKEYEGRNKEEEFLIEEKDNLEQKAKELIQDKIDVLSRSQMQDLVAALLRAMGYKTKISPPGPDGGKDIIATKDGFGFQDPTIIVEVKHRKESMGGPAVNQLAGVIKPGQKGLFVSTGGFTKQAFDMAKSHHHIVLIDLDQLTDLVIEYYSQFDLEGQKLLPLTKIYRPL